MRSFYIESGIRFEVTQMKHWSSIRTPTMDNSIMTSANTAQSKYIKYAKKALVGLLLVFIGFLPIAYYLFYVQVTNSGLTFSNTLRIPELLVPKEKDGSKIFELIPQHGYANFVEVGKTETMGYNGNFLGPTIRVDKGEEVVINVTNQLDEMTTVHWHGMHVPANMDGTPHQMIPPGGTWQARYPILNEASTMWYHPHPHGKTAQQVYQGLVGLFIIDDENSKNLDLPNRYGIDDIPLVIQERLFNKDGSQRYELNKGAYYGDTILLNGTHNPNVSVPASLVRFRLLNGSNARAYHIGFEDDRTFHQIATDGGLLESPYNTKRVHLSPGERIEIVVDLSDGDEVLLKTFPEDELALLAEAVFADGIGNGHFEILKIIPKPTQRVSNELPQRLNTIKRWNPEEADKTRRMRLGGPILEGRPMPGPGPRIPINGKLMSMARVDEVVQLGDIEVWEIVNRGGQAHPFHIHDVQFLILDRNGVPPHPGEAGWKDTVLVKTNETVRFITQFNTYADPDIPYMYHCHILEHEDGGMMGQFLVIDPASN